MKTVAIVKTTILWIAWGSGARDGEACVTKGDEERNTKVKREGEGR